MANMINPKWWSKVWCIVLIVGTGPSWALAQGGTATIEGIVKDQTDAIIPGATVKLVNPQTNFQRIGTTNERGEYRFDAVPIGSYELKVEAPGFNTVTLTNLSLSIDQLARLDVRLPVAATEEKVVVTGEVPLVETATPTIGAVIENQRIVDLPLNGRNFLQLSLLTSGTLQGAEGGAQKRWGTATSGIGFSVLGLRDTHNNYMLDGIPIIDFFFNTATINPSVDAVHEFKVVQGSYSAEYGVLPGAQINIVTKSGTNKPNGTFFHFLRNEKLDAKNFFDDPNLPIPPYKHNQFGGSMGGPILKDKTFFFLNYEGFIVRQALTNRTILPTLKIRRGDLSGINPATGRPFPPIIDPLTRQPFPGNIIPADRIDNLSKALLGVVPLPNIAGAAAGELNHRSVDIRRENRNQFTARVDHAISPAHQFFSRYTFANNKQSIPFTFSGQSFNLPPPEGFGSAIDEVNQNLGIGISSVLTSRLVNDFRFGYNRHIHDLFSPRRNNRFLESLGLAQLNTTDTSIPFFSVPGFADLGEPDTTNGIVLKNNYFQFLDTILYSHARHAHTPMHDMPISLVLIFEGYTTTGRWISSRQRISSSLTGRVRRAERPSAIFCSVGHSLPKCLEAIATATTGPGTWAPSITTSSGLRGD